MTPDPDAAPDRPETSSEPAVLSAAEHRAIDAAVAGVAGLLVGRALFGRAGGLVAGLAAVGAGLLAKRRPGARQEEPAEASLHSAAPATEATPPAALTPVPVTQMRLETGLGTIDDGWAAVSGEALPSPGGFAPLTAAEEALDSVETAGDEVTAAALPESAPGKVAEEAARADLEDAGAFAEMPALFESFAPSADTKPAFAPEPDISPAVETPVTAAVEPFAFDDGPASVDVHVLPVAQLVRLADEALEKEVFMEDTAVPFKPKSMPAPAAQRFALLGDLPAEFAAPKEEEEPGPREEFLLIPDQSADAVAAEPVPPIQSVVAALSESRERSAAPALEGAPPSFGSPAPPAAEDKNEGNQPAIATPANPVPPSNSPFGLWEAPSQSTVPVPLPVSAAGALPAPFPAAAVSAVLPAAPVPVPATSAGTVAPVLPTLPTVPHISAAPAAPGGPVPDPDEIWRQAAAELTALRNATTRTFPPVPATAAPGAPSFPLLPANMDPNPILGVAPAATAADSSVPPWMKAVQADEPPASVRTGHEPSRDKAFLPTIKLSVPQGPQPLAARRPTPLPPVTAPASEPAPAPGAAPVTLPGYRAEPLLANLPPATSRDLTDIDAPGPGLPPLPNSLAAATTASVPAAALAPSPAFDFAGKLSAPAGDEKVFVPRAPSRRHSPEPYKRRTVTTFRVAILAIAAAAALGLAFKPQLKKIWEQKILGKSPEGGENAQPKPLETEGVVGDGSGVSIAPDRPPTPKSPPLATPASDPSPQLPPPASPSPETAPVPPSSPEPPPVPANTQPPADSVPVTITPLPPAEMESTGPLPVSEAGARELISRLLRATTPDGVIPCILDAARLAPTLESYFSGGRAVPVASYESLLERADKSTTTGRTVWLFRVTTDNVPRGFPLGVEDTPDGLRTDWELFTQCRDGALQAFLVDPSAPAGLYFAALKRAHVFPDMLPGKDHTKFFAFDLSPPALGGSSVNAFIPRSTPLATRADNLYKFSAPPCAPLLELAHKDGHVEITGIIRENWRNATRGAGR